MIAELPEALVSWAAPIVKDIIEQHRAANGGATPTDDEIIRTFKSNLPKYLSLGSPGHSHKNSPDYALIVDLPTAIFRGQMAGNGNETALDQKPNTPPDAVKARGGSWQEGHLMDLSGDLLSGDMEHPVRHEKCLLVFRTDDHPSVIGRAAGCFEFYTQDPDTTDDAGMKLRARLGCRGFEVFVPMLGAGTSGDSSGLTSPSGQFRAQMQDDGNL